MADSQMGHIMKANMWKVRSMAVGSLFLLTVLNTKVNLITMTFTELECISGQTRGNTTENGSATKCMEKE